LWWPRVEGNGREVQSNEIEAAPADKEASRHNPISVNFMTLFYDEDVICPLPAVRFADLLSALEVRQSVGMGVGHHPPLLFGK
jgi:hypothetical protein